MLATSLKGLLTIHNPQSNYSKLLFEESWESKHFFFPGKGDPRFIINMLLSLITLGPNLGFTKGMRQ